VQKGGNTWIWAIGVRRERDREGEEGEYKSIGAIGEARHTKYDPSLCSGIVLPDTWYSLLK